jgi:homoserine kinase
MELLERARSFGAIGASISGAGPTVLFWTHADTTGAVVAALQRETEGWAEVLRAPFQTSGAEVREL